MLQSDYQNYTLRLKLIKWFAHCGEPSPEHSRTAKTWKEAFDEMDSEDFDNRKMNAQNSLTAHLAGDHLIRYRPWNEIVDMSWAAIDEQKTKFRDAISSEVVRERVWSLSRSVITLALSEAWFSDVALPDHNYGRAAFAIFESGRLPCGYEGKFPKGKFKVY